MVTSKHFHTSLVLFLIGSIFTLLGEFEFVNNINGVPHGFALLVLASLTGYILFLIAIFRVKKINRFFLISFIIVLILITFDVLQVVFAFFTDNLLIDALNIGLKSSELYLDLLLYLYVILGVRDCYKQDLDTEKNISAGFFWTILGIAIAGVIANILIHSDGLLKNYYVTMVSKLLSYLLGISIPIVLIICFSRALRLSHKILFTKEKEEEKHEKENQVS